MNARRPDDALLNWRQIAAVVFAVGAVVASSPAVAAAAPDAEADSSTSADADGDSGTAGAEAGAGAEAEAEEATDGDDAAEESDDTGGDDTEGDDTEGDDTEGDDTEGDDTEGAVEAPEDDAEEFEEPDAEAEPKTRGSHYESQSRPESGAGAESDGDQEAVDADETTSETSTPEPTTPEPSTPASSTPAALSTIESAATTAEAPARTERPVNTATIVGDVLTWVGLGDSTADLPIPALPVPRLVEMFWLAVRQTQHSWNNQRPTAQPTLSAQGDDGVIRGALNAVDYDDTELTYTVATPARFGTVVVNTDGTFTYTPRPGIVVVTDTFTVTIDDPNSGVHGLGEMLGWTGATTATVIVGGAGSTDVGSSNVTRPGAVTVQMGTDGRISVIDGTFTETKVYDKAGAAALLNTYAPILNAQTGFAATDSITVHRVGGSGVVEEFYRLRQSVNGIEVIGSDVVSSPMETAPSPACSTTTTAGSPEWTPPRILPAEPLSPRWPQRT